MSRKSFGTFSVFAAVSILLLASSLGNTSASQSAASRPQLKVDGNDGKCRLKSGQLRSFRFVGTGFTPNDKVMILVFYPKGRTFPFGNAPNPHGFYWFHQNFGIYPVGAKGNFKSRPWDCRYGPNNTQDFTGKYTAMAIDLSSQKKVPFRVTP
jgi:hypothetical protein